jgi:hypothetical protein
MTHFPPWAAAAAELDETVRLVQVERPGVLEAKFQPPRIVIAKSGCWLWQANCLKGYGRTRLPRPWRRSVRAHRASYLLFRGPIPYGMTLDHLCRNTSCVNPDHLEPCSEAENRERAPVQMSRINTAKTHCPQGHPYDAENLRMDMTRRGIRGCRMCRDEGRRRDYALQRLAAQRLGLPITHYQERYGRGGKAAAEVLGIPWEAARHVAA